MKMMDTPSQKETGPQRNKIRNLKGMLNNSYETLKTLEKQWNENCKQQLKEESNKLTYTDSEI